MSAGRQQFDPTVNYYQVLDVPVGATREEITRAYRALIRHVHPDTVMEPEQRAKAEERAKLINAAYHVLSKPALRTEYDRAMRQRIMSETLMQRYTGTNPGRPSPIPTPPRPPSRQSRQRQRRAFNSAVGQIFGAAATVMVILVAILVLGSLAAVGLRFVF
ncbi:MAG: molecular chaperone DnaJ [Chloroflexi bacterium]|nr:MAG: molecular chaperone DnaJ [Chloroflexota bacterium]